MGFGWSNAVYAEGSRDLIRENPVAGNGDRPFLDYRNDFLEVLHNIASNHHQGLR
jgi:hypothetical protein